MTREILVLYYSRHGSTRALAEAVATGVDSVSGASARVRTVPDVTTGIDDEPPAAIPDTGPPYAAAADLDECAGLILGSPTRFGNMAAALKYFLDGTTTQWLSGALAGKPAGVFTSSASPHGGQETTLLTMAIPLIHHGMVFVGVPYSVESLTATDGGGAPYGPGHVSGPDNATELSRDERIIARALGRRVASVAIALAEHRPDDGDSKR